MPLLGGPISNLKKSSDGNGNGLQRFLSRQRNPERGSKRHWRQQYVEEDGPESAEINVDKLLIFICFRYKNKKLSKIPKNFPR